MSVATDEDVLTAPQVGWDGGLSVAMVGCGDGYELADRVTES